MRKNLLFVSAAIVALLSSCIKENISAPECNLDPRGGVTFTASYELPTKTAYDSETGKVTWEVGDAVKFDYEIAAGDSVALISEPLVEEDINAEGGASFTTDEVLSVFKMTEKEYKESLEEGAKNSRHLYVSYPAAIETEYGTGAYYVTVPKVQDGKFESASIALAKWNAYAPTDPLHFMNFCALVKFTVDESMTAVRQIRFTAANRSIVGKASVTFTSQVPYTPLVKEVKEDEAASTTITVNVDGPGTYYASVLPGELKEICYAYYDAEGNPVGEIVSSAEFTAERSRVYNLNANIQEGSFPGEGGFFVKPVASGTGDGSSWDNAADYAALHAKLDNTTNYVTDTENPDNSVNNAVTLTVHMAAGTHEVTKQLNVTPAHNVKIYGGYPADAKGMSLAGRDPSANVTVLDGKNAVKIWNLTNGTWEVDGLTFKNANFGSGSAITLQKTVNITVSDCVFRDNVATGAGGAAVLCQGLTSDKVLFEDCKFIGNKATTTKDANSGLGGAIMGSSLPTDLGTITLSKCLFQENSAALGGGAICPRTMHSRVLDCTFVDNTGASYGDAIYLENSAKVTMYCDGCNFYYTKADFVTAEEVTTNAIISVNNTNSVLGLSNCVVSGPWAGKTAQLMTKKSKSVVLVNSTLFAQTSYPSVLAQGGNVNIINSIVLNAASKGVGRAIANQSKTSICNTIFTKVDEKTASGNVEVTSTTDITVYGSNLKVVSNTAETFPVKPTWYGENDHAGVMWNNKNATTTTVDDCRGKLYYYAWDGEYPEGTEFTNATLEQVTQMVKDADENFATWLGDRLGKDIRGNARDAQSMWPGSYQK